MRIPRYLDIVPNLGAIVFILVTIGGFGAFVWGSLIREQSKRDVYIAYSFANPSQPTAYILLDADGSRTNGFRNPQYPMGMVKFEVVDTVFAPHWRGRRVPIATLSSTKLFTVRISDGSRESQNGQYWDFPSIDAQWAAYDPDKSTQRLSGIMEEFDDEFNEKIKGILSGIPDSGNPIPQPRRELLIQLTMDALSVGGYKEAERAIQDQQSKYSHIVWSGWLKLIGFVSIVAIITWVFSLIFASAKKTPKAS